MESKFYINFGFHCKRQLIRIMLDIVKIEVERRPNHIFKGVKSEVKY